MDEILVQQYNAFSTIQGKGNPAGVILQGGLTSEEMQHLALRAGHSECCFVLPSSLADYRFRYFMPSCETPLCGHATVATLLAIADQEGWTEDRTLTIETLAGILPLQYHAQSREVVMTQTPAQFRPFMGDVPQLMSLIGLTMEDLDTTLPIVYGSTGTYTLILPIKTLSAFHQMTPHTQDFPQVLDNPGISIHPITSGGFDSRHHLHGRHFSAATSGSVEDSVTGTASGVMGGYYLTHLSQNQSVEILVEQGNEMGMEGTVRVFAERVGEDIAVSIAGTAVQNGEAMVSLC